MDLPLASWILLGMAAFGAGAISLELFSLARLRSRKLPEPDTLPRFSILKPLCGLDDELVENLESHLRIDYPGEFELVLGVRSEQDAAYPIAKAFAQAHPGRVRLVLQEGEPGHNPKVNQLITLTRAARYECIALTDSNVRVPPHYLREHAVLLSNPSIGLSSNVFVGVGERRIGAVLDNMALASFAAPNIAAGSEIARIDQVVGKSIAMRKETLEKVGGWHEVKDVLAEDQRLGRAVRKLGLRTTLCPTPVHNIQRDQPFAYFWQRNTRWAMIRFRVLPLVVLEPLLNVFLMALLAALIAPASGLAWGAALGGLAFSVLTAQISGRILRGHGFRLTHLLLIPLRDLTFFACWARGATMRTVNWRGNQLLVLAKTRLAAPTAFARVKHLQKITRE